MPDERVYINVFLTEKETQLLNEGKDKSGINGTSDFIRHLITTYVKK